jgi:hypothetical protein
MAFNFLRPGAPHNQPLVDLPTARSAIAVAVINAGITVVAGNSEQMYYDVDLYRRANFATAVLGDSAWRSWSWARRGRGLRWSSRGWSGSPRS